MRWLLDSPRLAASLSTRFNTGPGSEIVIFFIAIVSFLPRLRLWYFVSSYRTGFSPSNNRATSHTVVDRDRVEVGAYILVLSERKSILQTAEIKHTTKCYATTGIFV
jgi:hypothetical protein